MAATRYPHNLKLSETFTQMKTRATLEQCSGFLHYNNFTPADGQLGRDIVVHSKETTTGEY
jgi:hypothetical protein